MIKSMTGFGRGESVTRHGKIVIELRTLNHRFFEPVLRLPNSFSLFESKIKECIHKKIKRGRINLSLLYEHRHDADTVSIDKPLVKKYRKIISILKKELGVDGNVGIGEILSAFPNIITYREAKINIETLWNAARKALNCAISAAARMRTAEGRILYADLAKRAEFIAVNISSIKNRLPRVVSEYKQKLSKRLKELRKLPGFNKGRVEEEVALFAKHSDITEEITRARAHLNNFKKALNAKTETGRELDFIMQELHREVNTIGSKAADFKISCWTIKIKSEIEKMREQVQNIE